MSSSPSSRTQLILTHYDTVHRVARQVARRYGHHVTVDDLVSIGTLGLIDAVDRYDEERHASFAGYARIRVKGAMVDALRQGDWVPRSVRQRHRLLAETQDTLSARLGRTPKDAELASALEVDEEELDKLRKLSRIHEMTSLDAPKHGTTQSVGDTLASSTEGPEELAHQEDLRQQVVGAIATLPERDRRIVQLYYYEGLNLKEIAEILTVSESRVCQLLGRCRRRLRATLEPALDSLTDEGTPSRSGSSSDRRSAA